MISSLPPELFKSYIFPYLSKNDLLQICFTCKQWAYYGFPLLYAEIPSSFSCHAISSSSVSSRLTKSTVYSKTFTSSKWYALHKTLLKGKLQRKLSQENENYDGSRNCNSCCWLPYASYIHSLDFSDPESMVSDEFVLLEDEAIANAMITGELSSHEPFETISNQILKLCCDIVTRCHNLTKIKLSNGSKRLYGWLDDSIFNFIHNNAHSHRESTNPLQISYSASTSISDCSFPLREIHIQIQEQSLSTFNSQEFPSLDYSTLNRTLIVTDDGLIALIKRSPHLKKFYLDVNRKSLVTSYGLFELTRRSKLEEFGLTRFFSWADEVIDDLPLLKALGLNLSHSLKVLKLEHVHCSSDLNMVLSCFSRSIQDGVFGGDWKNISRFSCSRVSKSYESSQFGSVRRHPSFHRENRFVRSKLEELSIAVSSEFDELDDDDVPFTRSLLALVSCSQQEEPSTTNEQHLQSPDGTDTLDLGRSTTASPASFTLSRSPLDLLVNHTFVMNRVFKRLEWNGEIFESSMEPLCQFISHSPMLTSLKIHCLSNHIGGVELLIQTLSQHNSLLEVLEIVGQGKHEDRQNRHPELRALRTPTLMQQTLLRSTESNHANGLVDTHLIQLISHCPKLVHLAVDVTHCTQNVFKYFHRLHTLILYNSTHLFPDMRLFRFPNDRFQWDSFIDEYSCSFIRILRIDMSTANLYSDRFKRALLEEGHFKHLTLLRIDLHSAPFMNHDNSAIQQEHHGDENAITTLMERLEMENERFNKFKNTLINFLRHSTRPKTIHITFNDDDFIF